MSTQNKKRQARLLSKKQRKEEDAFLDTLIAENKTVLAESTTPVEAPTVTTQQAPTTQQAENNVDIPINMKDEQITIPRAQIIEKANSMWKIVKTYAASNPDFRKLKDQDKLDIFRTKLNYGVFMDEFPIVTRYMICHGQYSAKAFDRMLFKVEKTVHPPESQREKGYMEDQWIRRQADYVQYLWESYQKPHYNQDERKWIWQSAYDRLRQEFDDFRTMHKDIEERVKSERKELAGQNVRDLLERIASGKQSLSPEEENFLLEELRRVITAPDVEESAPVSNNHITVIDHSTDEYSMYPIDRADGESDMPQLEVVETNGPQLEVVETAPHSESPQFELVETDTHPADPQ